MGRRSRKPAASRGPAAAATHALLVLVVCLALARAASGAVLGIDYGSDWFKVALGRPGKPIDLVLNRESKRKTHSLLTLRTDERFFGTDAAALAPRFSTTTFPHLKVLLGKLANSTEAERYAALFPPEILADADRGTVRFAGLNNDSYSVEELVAMQLSHARAQAEDSLKKPVKDAVITIPPYFNQFEREALLAAADLAGLRVLSLLHDETAVAINYALSRQFKEPQTHIFYNMGASSTSAALVRFEQDRKATKVIVKAVGYDASLGGSTIDASLVKHLEAAFTEKFGSKLTTPLASNPRARTKLLREAARVKTILSVNSQIHSSIESLHEDHDLRLTITRAELEAMVEPLADRVLAPVRALLASPDAKAVDSLVLVGGGVRVPQIQRWLESTVGADKIAKNVNADEAAVLGAAYRAAVLARAFRVGRDIQVTDGLPYAVNIGKATLFAAQAPMVAPAAPGTIGSAVAPGVLKTVTIRKTEDFDLTLTVPGNTGGAAVPLASIASSGINASFVEQKLTFKLDPRGVVSLTNATAVVKESRAGGLLDSIVGKTSETNSTIQLNVTVTPRIAPLAADQLLAAQTRLRKWDAAEHTRRAREAARNSLEALVYQARDRADSDDRLAKVATADERDALLAAAKATGDWLDEADDDEATLDALKSHRADLAAKLDALFGRWTAVQTALDQIRADFMELNVTSTWADEYADRDKFAVDEVRAKADEVHAKVEELRRELARAEEERIAREKAEAERKAAEELARQELERAAAEAKKAAEEAAKAESAPAAESSTSAAAAESTSAAAASESTTASSSSAPAAEETTAKASETEEAAPKPTTASDAHTEL
ncbi:lumenal Hsp70 protein [Blastocladiella emersonii ATCC 22665]|nr:lumenal Hsp70 protein [Blastocladiella emersonii ATCC 22665]